MSQAGFGSRGETNTSGASTDTPNSVSEGAEGAPNCPQGSSIRCRFEIASYNRDVHTLAITWLGHATFIVRTPGGKRILLDPWLTDNPACPASHKKPPHVDMILASHGHSDHIGDLVACARATSAVVVAAPELCDWVSRKGIQHVSPMNKGGSQEIAGLRRRFATWPRT